jgi:hypothetical protein
MKTAVSIDNEVYRSAEEAAGQMRLTRSKLYTLAVAEYIQNHSPGALLKQLNEVYRSADSGLDDDIQGAQFDLFSQEDW